MYQQDWIMRQIESIINMISRFVFKKEIVNYDIVNEPNYEDTNYLYKKILNLINLGEINEAENLLFNKLDKDNLNYLLIGLEFYSRINKFSDERLLESNFSRVELELGLKDLGEIYGVDSLFYNKLKQD